MGLYRVTIAGFRLLHWPSTQGLSHKTRIMDLMAAQQCCSVRAAGTSRLGRCLARDGLGKRYDDVPARVLKQRSMLAHCLFQIIRLTSELSAVNTVPGSWPNAAYWRWRKRARQRSVFLAFRPAQWHTHYCPDRRAERP
jgi:hypothetical protein